MGCRGQEATEDDPFCEDEGQVVWDGDVGQCPFCGAEFMDDEADDDEDEA